MSDKKNTTSSSHEYRAVTYLEPAEFRIVQAYARFTGESKSSVVHLAVTEFIKKIPHEQKAIIVQVGSEE